MVQKEITGGDCPLRPGSNPALTLLMSPSWRRVRGPVEHPLNSKLARALQEAYIHSMSEAEITPLAQALGRVSSGLYVVTSVGPKGPLGFVGSFVSQVGFKPPTISLAIEEGRDHLAAIREHGHFGLSILDQDSSKLMGAFFKKYEEGTSPFDSMEMVETECGVPVLGGALGWLTCKLTSEHKACEHVVVFGEVLAGALLREGDPLSHVRKDGLKY